MFADTPASPVSPAAPPAAPQTPPAGTPPPASAAPSLEQAPAPAAPATAPDPGGDSSPAWLPARLERAEQAAVRKLLAELGLESTDALKAALAAGQQTKTADQQFQAELEKVRGEQKRLADALAQQTKAAEEQTATARRERINSALVAAAAKAGVQTPEDVILWATAQQGLIDPTKLLDKAEQPVADAIDAVIAKVKEARPGWFRVTPGSPSFRDGAAPPLDEKRKTAAAAEVDKRVRASF